MLLTTLPAVIHIHRFPESLKEYPYSLSWGAFHCDGTLTKENSHLFSLNYISPYTPHHEHVTSNRTSYFPVWTLAASPFNLLLPRSERRSLHRVVGWSRTVLYVFARSSENTPSVAGSGLPVEIPKQLFRKLGHRLCFGLGSVRVVSAFTYSKRLLKMSL